MALWEARNIQKEELREMVEKKRAKSQTQQAIATRWQMCVFYVHVKICMH